jgi:hypothetical protein
MHRIRTLTAAAAIVLALQGAGWTAPAAAEAPSPDVAYNAPSWWIAAVIEGKQSSLLSGLPDSDRRMNVWLAGFGYGFGSGCGISSQTRQLEALLQQHIAARPAMKGPSTQGIQDGRRFAQLNGCSNDRAAGVLRTVASIGNSSVVADATGLPDDNRQSDRFQNRQNDRFQRQPAQAANDATIHNYSGTQILVLRISETWDTQWGVDRLGDGVLENGAAVRLALPGSRTCHYDLQVTYRSRQVEERRNVNLCQANQVVFDGSAVRFPRSAGVALRPDVVR